MAFSSGGKAEMNVTPMIDILLVLIIIFLLIVPVTPNGEEASIPREPETKSDEPLVRSVVIEVGKNAEITINKQPVTWENLRARLIEIYKERAEKVAFVRADADTDFEKVAQVIDVVHAVGVPNVGLMK